MLFASFCAWPARTAVAVVSLMVGFIALWIVCAGLLVALLVAGLLIGWVQGSARCIAHLLDSLLLVAQLFDDRLCSLCCIPVMLEKDQTSCHSTCIPL